MNAVVGYDDLPIASYTCPPLTTIRRHPFEQGKLLAEAAIVLMNSEKVGSQPDALPLELVIRKFMRSEKLRTRILREVSTEARPAL
jgi:DNA-binding LacI/PurR family transcriptional regulator